MQVSIITACYNSAATIADTFASVGRQRNASYEYIVIDGASADETRTLIRRHQRLITTAVSEPDDGIYDALNKGISRATGDVVGFLHADDVFADELVLSRIAVAFEDSNVQACYGDLVYVAQDDLSRVSRYWRAGSFNPRKLKRGWMPPHPTLYVRRELYEQVGGFDLSYRIAADYESILRLLGPLEASKVAYIPSVQVRMRNGGTSNRVGNLLSKSSEDYRALRANRIGGFGALAWKNLSKLGQFLQSPNGSRP